MLANNIGMLWNQISAQSINNLPILNAWLGAFAFTFQIYFDFSGYSDMAIGLGRMFGFKFLENFDHPYESKNITEFWRKWHISLGTWFREYVYIPLGGSREGKIKLIRNLLIVWGLTGLWHGASWNFVLWGIYFGVILIIEKLILQKYIEKMPKILQHIYTMFIVIISWVIFAFEDISQVGLYLKSMFGLNNTSLYNNEFLYLISTNKILLIICIIASTSIFKKIYLKLMKKENKTFYSFVETILYIMFFLVSVSFLIGNTYNPFLYFRF